MKSKLPQKKAKGSSDELEEIDDEGTDSSQIGERTDVTDITDLESEDEPKSDSLIHKLKNKIKNLNKGKADKADDAEEESQDSSSGDAAAKKKKRQIIQYALGISAVLILFYDDIFPPETPETAVTSFKKPERKKPAKTEAPAEVVATPEEAPAPTEVAPAETAGAEVTEPAPTEPVPTEPAPETAAGTDVTTETTPDSPVTVTSETAPPVETTESVPVETAPAPEPVITETPQSTDEPISLGEPENNPVSVDSIDGGETTTPGDENLTDQILQDLEKQAKTKQAPEQKKEYVAPPDYEYRGRGLVYNCKGKHWACIDAPSYKICEDNAFSVKYLNKKTECHPFNVYETTRGCENIQNRMVSSSAKTNFCNE